MFSQWYPHPFEVDGVTYATAEHWMMAGKARLFGDPGKLASILATADPATAKALGRQVAGFSGEVWGAHRFEIVATGSELTFASDPELRRHLVATGDQVLVEASPQDAVWGIGVGHDHPAAAVPSRWPGLNLLGFALMEARGRLAAAVT